MAGAQGCLRALARAGEFRRTGTAADELERVERRALDHVRVELNQCKRRTRSAPSPLVGEGGEGGDAARSWWRHLRRNRTTPTPNPSPQGGGERTEYAALTCFN